MINKINKAIDSTKSNKELSNINSDTKANVDNIIGNNINSIVEKYIKKCPGFSLNENIIDHLYDSIPNLTPELFESIFFCNTYNKIILSCDKEILEFIDFAKVKAGDDLIQVLISNISLSEEDFQLKIKDKFHKLTFPNLSTGSVSLKYFYQKMQDIFKETDIIFGDNVEILENVGINQVNNNSIGFIDPSGNGPLNTCLLKLLKTNPDPKKVEILNNLFEDIKEDIFIGGNTSNIHFNLPEGIKGISFPNNDSGNRGAIRLLPNGMLLNSMGYLNSAFYTKKVKSSFILGSHNIAEPIHAGNLTVINNELKNKYNHNWIISYFGEKAGLLLYTKGDKEDTQKSVNDFLSIDNNEVQRRNKEFKIMYEEEIKPLLFGILYLNLKKQFPEIL